MIVKGEFKRKKLYRGMGEVNLPPSPYISAIANKRQEITALQNLYNNLLPYRGLPDMTLVELGVFAMYGNISSSYIDSVIAYYPSQMNTLTSQLNDLLNKEQQWIAEQTQMILKAQLEETVALQETQSNVEFLSAQLMANKNLNNTLLDQINEKTITIGVMEKTLSNLQGESTLHTQEINATEKEIISVEEEVKQTEREINNMKAGLAKSISNVEGEKSSSTKLLIGIGAVLVGGYTLLKE